ncbi:MAG: GNAT family N-acetyltransferase [Patescibacteria group bacterium]
MDKITLRKIKLSDIKYFAKWWRDKELLKLTSGILKPISDQEVEKYFLVMLRSKNYYHFMIIADGKTIGHISSAKRQNNWHETQIVIGEKKYWGKGYGSRSIKLLIRKAKLLGISKIYLEVRPSNLRAIKAYENCGFVKIRIKKYSKNKYLPETLKMELKDL